MMLTSTVNLLQTLCLSAGIHAEVMQSDATRTLCGLLRMLVESGTIDKSGMLYRNTLIQLYAAVLSLLSCNFVDLLLLVSNPLRPKARKYIFSAFKILTVSKSNISHNISSKSRRNA